MQNLRKDYDEIVKSASSSSILKNYLEKKQLAQKSRIYETPSTKPKGILNETLNPIDYDPNMTRHRSHIIKSRMVVDRSKKVNRKISRDVSSFLDSQVLASINEIHNKTKNELFDFDENVENPANFYMPCGISELKKILSEDDLKIWSIIGLDNQKFHEYSHEFTQLGISKACQVLPNDHGGPSNRKEAQLLSSWLSFMLQSLLDSTNMNESVLFENAQIVYTACLKEIFRQVSVHCIERGELLQRVWKAYFSILINSINVFQKSKILLEKRLEAELSVTKEKFKSHIGILEDIIKQKDSEICDQSVKIANQENKIERMNVKNDELKHRLFLLQMKYSKDRVRLITLEDEYRNLKEVQKIVLEEMDEDFPGIKKVQVKQKIRFRELSKIFMTDPLCGNLTEVKVPKVPKSEVRSLIELDKIDLENKIKMHEIQEKIEETAEELIDIALDTKDLAIPLEKFTQTKFKNFDQPVVDVYSEQHLPQELKLIEKILNERLKNEEINQTDLENFFWQSPGTDSTDLPKVNFDIIHTELHEKMIKEINQDKEKKSLRTVVRKITNSVVEYSQKTLEKIKEKFEEKLSQTKTDAHDVLKLRKQIFITFKENIKLSDELAKAKEQLEKISKSQKNRKKFKRAVNSTKKKTVVKEFKLNQRIVLFSKDSISPAEAIFHRAAGKKETKVKVNIRNVTLLKLVNSLIADYAVQMKEDLIPQTQPLYIYVYDYFVAKHGGVKKIVDAKYKQMLAACEYHKSIPAIRLFCRFLGLFDPLEIEFFRTLININELLSKFSRIGVDIPTAETEDQLIPSIRAFEVIFVYFKEKFSENEILNMKNDLQKFTKPCPKCINQGVVEKSELVYFIIQHYKNFLILSTNNVKELFEAADLNDDKFLQFEEFDLLFKSIEPKKYTNELSKLYFQSYSDLIAEVNGENFPAISYERFSICALEKGLFSKHEQEMFIGPLSSQELQKKMGELCANAEKIIEELRWRLLKSQKVTTIFKDMIEILKKKFEENDQRRSVYIAYLLINGESKSRMLDTTIDSHLPLLVKFYEKAKMTFYLKKERNKELRKQLTWKKSMEDLSDWDEKEAKEE